MGYPQIFFTPLFFESALHYEDVVDSDGTPDSDMLGMTISSEAVSAALAVHAMTDKLRSCQCQVHHIYIFFDENRFHPYPCNEFSTDPTKMIR